MMHGADLSQQPDDAMCAIQDPAIRPFIPSSIHPSIHSFVRSFYYTWVLVLALVLLLGHEHGGVRSHGVPSHANHVLMLLLLLLLAVLVGLWHSISMACSRIHNHAAPTMMMHANVL
jgi:hypothetical protein